MIESNCPYVSATASNTDMRHVVTDSGGQFVTRLIVIYSDTGGHNDYLLPICVMKQDRY